MVSVVVILFTLLNLTFSYKILVYNPQFGHSHVTFLGHIADTLVEAGHDVLVYLPEVNKDVTRTGVRLAKTLVRPLDFPSNLNRNTTVFWEQRTDSLVDLFKFFYKFGTPLRELCKRQLKDEELLERLRRENFDLAIGEVIDRCFYLLMDVIGVKVYISAFALPIIEGNIEPFHIPNPPSYVPGAMTRFCDQMNYAERIINYSYYLFMRYMFYKSVTSVQDIALQTLGIRDFDLMEKMARSSFLFVNSDEFVDFPRPVTQKVVYIGGIGVKDSQKLPESFQRIMDEARSGVVLVSFGTLARSSDMPENLKNAFLEAFQFLPNVTFLWKYEHDDGIADDLKNVYKTNWLPQNDLLGHPNLKAFVSHCGLNSVMEAIHKGVPLVCIPLFGDQLRNSRMVHKKKVAMYLDKEGINGKLLINALETVLFNDEIRKSAQNLALLLRKRPFTPEQKVVRYVEFAAEFGNTDHLAMASEKLNLLQIFSIDIIIPALLLLLLVLIITIKAIWSIFRKFVIIGKLKYD